MSTSSPDEARSAAAAPVAAQSFEQVYGAYSAFVWRNARRLGVPSTGAEDVVQDVFIVVQRRLPDFDGRTAIQSWIFGILVRVVGHYRRSYQRKDARCVSLEQDAGYHNTGLSGARNPSEQAEHTERLRLLEELLGQLDEDKRTLLVLSELEGWTLREIAEYLGSNTNTVHSRLRAAKRAFEDLHRRCLAEKGRAVNDSHDKDDWSNDSESLFREARRAHDPTLAESARLAAVLERIQAAKTEPTFDADRGADIVARGAASKMLRLVASVSLGVVCIAGVSFVFNRVNRDPFEPARRAEHASAVVASAPPPIAAQPAPVPSGELRASAHASEAHDEAHSRPRSQQRRRSRATAERQRTSRIEMASVPEASSSAPHDNATSVTVPENSATRDERPTNAIKAVAAIQEAAPPAKSFESNPQEAVSAAGRNADPTPPENAPTELAMMKRIQGALRDADFSTVLALCTEHARYWPHGVFELEREGARAIASCGGNSDDATLHARRFLTAHPHASVAMRVSAACAAQLKKP